MPQGTDQVLQSNNERISNIKKRPLGEELEQLLKSPMEGTEESLNNLLVTGLVELCRVKPVGVDAVKWLGNWLLENNPKRPNVEVPDN